MRKTIEDISMKILAFAVPIYRPPPKPTEIPLQEIPRNLMDLDTESNMDFEGNSPFQEGVVSEMYQRSNRSYIQEPPELDSLISTGKLVKMPT